MHFFGWPRIFVNSGRAFCEKPCRSSPPFCAPLQVWKLLRQFCINFGWDFTYTSITGQQNISIQINYKVIVSQVSVVMSQMAHRKCWKRNLQEALGQVANGKWFLQESLPISKFLKCFKKTVFFLKETFSFWLLGNANNPTDLKPYWSRAGLRHPDLWWFNVF